MGSKARSGSIFSQQLDRAIFVTFFLGGIVPLIALGMVMHYYVFPALRRDLEMTQAMLGVIGGVSLLSLASFFALRRLVSNALDRMRGDNARLKNILAVSKGLSTSLHAHAVAEIAVTSARELTGARIAYVMMRPSDDKPLVLVESSGHDAGAIYSAHESLIRELVEASVSNHAVTSMATGAVADLGAGLAFPLIADDAGAGAIVVLNPNVEGGCFPTAEQDALMTLSTLTGVAMHNVDLQDAQRNFFSHITELLVAAMDTHIDGRRGHANAVAQLANRLARELELPDDRMQTLHFSALLHDLGMLKVDRAHQRSPGHFQKHPQVAHRVLSRIRLWEDAAPIVLSHHEWWDGSGYPENLEGEDIPLESRIIAVADCYDVMIRPDSHRMAMTPRQALQEIRDYAGRQFDPEVSAALERIAERGEIPSTPA